VVIIKIPQTKITSASSSKAICTPLPFRFAICFAPCH
jgi:hypothetical protein